MEHASKKYDDLELRRHGVAGASIYTSLIMNSMSGGGGNVAPSITGVPTISGDTGLGDTLTFTPASVTGTPTPTRTWQVYRDAAPVGSPQSGNTYVIVEADLGTDITVQQIETNSEGTDTATSAATSIPSASPDLLLDTYTGAAAAYSLRKLRNAYTGAAIRVRESGGNAEADIGFDANGELDQVALLAHCGANDGFVVTWYDQSGNGRNATQATATAQPKIVNAGVVLTSGALPRIETTPLRFLNVSTSLDFRSFASVMYWTNGSFATPLGHSAMVNNIIICNGNNVTTELFNGGGGGTIYQNGSTGPPYLTHTSRRIYHWTRDSAIAGTVSIGRRWGTSTSSPIEGNFQEVIIFETDQSANRTAIESNINAHYGIY